MSFNLEDFLLLFFDDTLWIFSSLVGTPIREMLRFLDWASFIFLFCYSSCLDFIFLSLENLYNILILYGYNIISKISEHLQIEIFKVLALLFVSSCSFLFSFSCFSSPYFERSFKISADIKERGTKKLNENSACYWWWSILVTDENQSPELRNFRSSELLPGGRHSVAWVGFTVVGMNSSTHSFSVVSLFPDLCFTHLLHHIGGLECLNAFRESRVLQHSLCAHMCSTATIIYKQAKECKEGWCSFFFTFSVAFTSETIWSWTFLCWEFFSYWFSLLVSYTSVLSISSWFNFGSVCF